MAAITASMVAELRAKTTAPMMEGKKACPLHQPDLADDTPDAGLNHSNDKDEAKDAGSKSSVDEDYKAISRKAGNPPVINTMEGKELTAGIHRMWQSITGNKGK